MSLVNDVFPIIALLIMVVGGCLIGAGAGGGSWRIFIYGAGCFVLGIGIILGCSAWDEHFTCISHPTVPYCLSR